MAKFQLIVNELSQPKSAYNLELSNPIKNGAIQFQAQQLESDQDTSAVSWFGTPIRDRLTIQNDNIMSILDNVVITVSMAKNIVKTAINGRKGTVKEWVSDGDYSVAITGALYGRSNKYPKQEVDALLEVLQSNVSIKCQSDFLDLFGIYQMVIESFSMPQSQGQLNVQPFEISAISDQPIELLINV